MPQFSIKVTAQVTVLSPRVRPSKQTEIKGFGFISMVEICADQPVAGNECVGVVARFGLSQEFAARTFQNQPTRRNIPESNAGFDVGIETPIGDVGQRESCGAHDPNFSDPMDETLKYRHHRVKSYFRFREADRHD